MLTQGLQTEGVVSEEVWGRESCGGVIELFFLSDLALIPGWGYLLFRNRLDLKSTIFNNRTFPNLQLDCHRMRLCTFASGPSRVVYGEFSPCPTRERNWILSKARTERRGAGLFKEAVSDIARIGRGKLTKFRDFHL